MSPARPHGRPDRRETLVSDRHATTTRTPLMRAALAWAERGWHLFPCAPGVKPPALRDVDWREISTTDRAQIERWWTERPYNIGIDCGKSGLAVIDLDVPGHSTHPTGNASPRATGLDALLRISTEHGHPAPDPTFTVSTPSGGYHLYYTAAEILVGSSTGRLAPLIDVRGAGGYVIAPGSRINGRPYAVLNLVNSIPLAPLPSWLADLHETPAPPPGVPVKDLITDLRRAQVTRPANTLIPRQEHLRGSVPYSSMTGFQRDFNAEIPSCRWLLRGLRVG